MGWEEWQLEPLLLKHIPIQLWASAPFIKCQQSLILFYTCMLCPLILYSKGGLKWHPSSLQKCWGWGTRFLCSSTSVYNSYAPPNVTTKHTQLINKPYIHIQTYRPSLICVILPAYFSILPGYQVELPCQERGAATLPTMWTGHFLELHSSIVFS